MITTIPFSGFYESLHDDLLDTALEQMCRDEEGDVDSELFEDIIFACNWGKVHEEYAKAYVVEFADKFQIPSMRFNSLISPREYNFETDRILAFVSKYDMRRIWQDADKKAFSQLCKERLTDRSDFISFYDPDYKTWGRLDSWEPAQLGLLMECWTGEFNEWALMEDYLCNGHLDNMICNNLPREALDKLNSLIRENS